jgi:hypothetical protein
MEPENAPVTLFQLEVMRLRDTDVAMLHQIEQKQGAELVAFVSDWWGTRSRQILMEMFEAGQLDPKAYEEVSAHLKAQEQISWRELPEKWRRQFGMRVEW